MESLALLVSIILLTMFVATIASVSLSFVAKRWARVTSLVCSLPAVGIAVQLLVSVDSQGARIVGVGVAALIGFTWYRNYTFLRGSAATENS
jgi:anti-sigma-K factor RskA